VRGNGMTVGRSATGTVWNIQILRFVASAMVLFGHLNHEVTQRPKLEAHGFNPFAPVWWPGGVDIFFVISGFIMYYISVDHFARPGASWRFLERRIIRLVPPYWFFTALALAVMLILPAQMAIHEVRPWQAIASFIFIPALNPQGNAFPILILGWTLEFEMMFYAIFALGLMFRRTTGVAVIAAALLILALGSLVQPLPQPLGFWCNPIVLEFVFGIGVAMLHKRGVRLPIPVGVALAVLGVAALLALKAAGVPGTHWDFRFLWAGVPSLLMVTGLALIPEAERPGPIKRWLVFGGDASYALYLSHPFVLSAVAMVSSRIGITSPALYIGIGFFACLVGAAFVYQFMEQPVYKWLNGQRARLANRTTARSA
jgi:exopolysaccharide production protein ExoZ